jgi:putative sterol carrier protein
MKRLKIEETPVEECTKMAVKTPSEFFKKALPARFKPERAKGIDVVAQVKIDGSNGGEWTVTIRDQKMEVTEGTHQSPTLAIAMAETDFLDLVNGELSAEKAFFTGKIKFKGNITVALKLRDAGFL